MARRCEAATGRKGNGILILIYPEWGHSTSEKERDSERFLNLNSCYYLQSEGFESCVFLWYRNSK